VAHLKALSGNSLERTEENIIHLILDNNLGGYLKQTTSRYENLIQYSEYSARCTSFT